MIIVVTYQEEDPLTGRVQTLADYGYDTIADRYITLPCDPPERIGASFDLEIGEYVLRSIPPKHP